MHGLVLLKIWGRAYTQNISLLLGILPHSTAVTIAPTLCTASSDQQDCRFSTEVLIPLCSANLASLQLNRDIKQSAGADDFLPESVSCSCLFFHVFFSFHSCLFFLKNEIFIYRTGVFIFKGGEGWYIWCMIQGGWIHSLYLGSSFKKL